MDQFLAEYYNTLGFGDMVKESAKRRMKPGPGLVTRGSTFERAAEPTTQIGFALKSPKAPVEVPRPSTTAGQRMTHDIGQALQTPKARVTPPRPSTPTEWLEAEEMMRDRRMGARGGPGSERAPAPSPRKPSAPKPKPSGVKPAAAAAEEAAPGFFKRMGGRWKGLSRGGKAAIIAGTAAPLVAGGSYAAYRAMKNREKRSSDSAFDQLVEERAFDILYANGLADDQGNVVPPDEFEYEKTAGDFDSIVDTAALEMLEANGYPVEWS